MPIKKVTSWSQSKFITMSSFLFTMPILAHEYNEDKKWPYFILLTTSLISANFWRNPLYDWRRILDIYFAKFSFTYFLVHGIIYVPWPYNLLTSLNTLNIGYCYHKSHKEYEKRNRYWVWYHVGFHTCITLNVYYILKYFPRRNNILIATSVKM